MCDDPRPKIPQRSASQLEDGKWIQRIVVVVVIVDREFLRRIQNVIEP
jgi:hypothetical protein